MNDGDTLILGFDEGKLDGELLGFSSVGLILGTWLGLLLSEGWLDGILLGVLDTLGIEGRKNCACLSNS